MGSGQVSVAIVAGEAAEPGLRDEVLSSVLSVSFTPDELGSPEAFPASLEGRTLAVATDDGEVVGCGLSDERTCTPVALLSYLAVRPDRRGTGVGAALLSTLQQTWRESEARVVLGEVHDPRHWPDTADEKPGDRLRFYERHGARLLGLPWVQPRLSPTGDRVGGMTLIVVGGHDVPEVVPAAWIRGWAQAYYLFEEGADTLGETGLDVRISAQEGYRLRPISDYPDVAPL